MYKQLYYLHYLRYIYYNIVRPHFLYLDYSNWEIVHLWKKILGKHVTGMVIEKCYVETFS